MTRILKSQYKPKKENKDRDRALPDFKTYYKATAIKTIY